MNQIITPQTTRRQFCLFSIRACCRPSSDRDKGKRSKVTTVYEQAYGRLKNPVGYIHTAAM